ncbi:MAG: ArsR family transcriptional regulator [Bacteroidota bacterium]|nr:ArsR family transcriptional regulator [Bacteroidota bacterium]MDX5405360.1 ArsR family transcriptional regulator [Bacteroidota bacterium]MDX5428731.1 ArsR family transcriptional regulator [Bacteroidota bacterium]MDX5447532.1 ArsR family transcriptional regulator [Bacteroidota bacterium]MDX5506457.1 ArsR family transcriptional regulator [Bacteroidota bacterium]
MLETLITSKTRVKLLLKFFLNPSLKAYLRKLEQEFGEGSNAIRLELNKFEKAGLLNVDLKGNKKFYQANQEHPMFTDIRNLVLKYSGVDQVVERIAKKLGNLEKVYLHGRLANGLDSPLIELILVGEDIDKGYLAQLVEKAEKMLHKKITFGLATESEFEKIRQPQIKYLLIWNQ